MNGEAKRRRKRTGVPAGWRNRRPRNGRRKEEMEENRVENERAAGKKRNKKRKR